MNATLPSSRPLTCLDSSSCLIAAGVAGVSPPALAWHSVPPARQGRPTTRGAGPTRRSTMANAWFETVAEAQRRAKKRLPKGVYGALVAGSERGLSAEDNTAAFAELGFAPHTAGPGQRAEHGRDGHGPAHVDAGHDQPDRRAGGAPRRRGRRRPRRRGPRRGDGPVVVRQQADRGGRRGQPADVLPDVLGRHPRGDARPHGAGPPGRRRRDDRDPRLVVRLRPRLGQPVHPGEDQLRGGPQVRAAGAGQAPLAARLRAGPGRSPTSPSRTWSRTPATRRRPSSARTACGCSRRCPPGRTSPGCASSGAGRSCSRASCGSTTPSAPSTPASPRSRCPTTAATTSTGRRPRSAPCRPSPTPSATRSRCCWTAASGAAATSPRPSPWARRRS